MASILGTVGAPFAQIGGALDQAIAGLNIPLTDLANWITVGGAVASSTGNNYVSLGKSDQQYQVTAGKTFVAPGFFYYSNPVDTIFIGYANTALVAVDTATPPTTPISLFGPSTNVAVGNLRVNTASKTTWVPIPIIVPASKYMFFRCGGTASGISILIVGKEV